MRLQIDMPPGDVLIHCGDLLMLNSKYTRDATMAKLHDLNDWLGGLSYTEKVVIGGNHDFALQELSNSEVSVALSNCTCVQLSRL